MGTAVGVCRRVRARCRRNDLRRRPRARDYARRDYLAGGQVDPDPGGAGHCGAVPNARDLREYGREKLQDTGESAALRRRHRDWYEQLVLRAEAEWIGPNQLGWIARLEREHRNLREALRFCLTEPAESEHGLRLAAA